MAAAKQPQLIAQYIQGLLGANEEAAAAAAADQGIDALEMGVMGTYFRRILNSMYAEISRLQTALTAAPTQDVVNALQAQIDRITAAADKLNAYRQFYIQIFGAFKDIYTHSQTNGNPTKDFVKRLFTTNPTYTITPNAGDENDVTVADRVAEVIQVAVVGGNKTNFSLKRSEKHTESLINKANILINKLKTKVNKAIVLTKNSPVMNKLLRTMNSKIKNIPQNKSVKSSKKTTGGKPKTVKRKSVKSKSVKGKSVKGKSVKSKK